MMMASILLLLLSLLYIVYFIIVTLISVHFRCIIYLSSFRFSFTFGSSYFFSSTFFIWFSFCITFDWFGVVFCFFSQCFCSSFYSLLCIFLFLHGSSRLLTSEFCCGIGAFFRLIFFPFCKCVVSVWFGFNAITFKRSVRQIYIHWCDGCVFTICT